ncbi:hypothetical protein P0D73_19820 [Paraburkholderia sp. RL18-101-BIB-B]|uniref:hypothetical protein n=1 Tax=Paraburkholderia sp. RL18-101-BIB-B TaxID=3031634 RepID=UPI0038B736D4
MNQPKRNRVILINAAGRTVSRFPADLKRIVSDAWRLGVATGAVRPNLGGPKPGEQKSKGAKEKRLYSRREFREIVRFLIRRRQVPRGTTPDEERAYLAACSLVLGAFIPINLSGAFMLESYSLRKGETDQALDVIVVRKNRPRESANRLPEPKENLEDGLFNEHQVKSAQRHVRKIFEENTIFNESISSQERAGLFCCFYPKSRKLHRGAYDRLNQHSYSHGVRILHSEFSVTGDDGRPLRISMKRLRDSFENGLGKDVPMGDKAKILNHKDKNLTGTVYEAVTDEDHLRFHHGLKAIPIAVRNDLEGASVWARESGLSREVIERLISGILATRAASCTDPVNGELAPKNGHDCPNTLACFHCHNLAVVVDDLYRLASLERRINLDLESGRLQGESRNKFLFILNVIKDEIFSKFEKRHIESARRRAAKELHVLWRRPLEDASL